jgi:hypothetical protein
MFIQTWKKGETAQGTITDKRSLWFRNFASDVFVSLRKLESRIIQLSYQIFTYRRHIIGNKKQKEWQGKNFYCTFYWGILSCAPFVDSTSWKMSNSFSFLLRLSISQLKHNLLNANRRDSLHTIRFNSIARLESKLISFNWKNSIARECSSTSLGADNSEKMRKIKIKMCQYC